MIVSATKDIIEKKYESNIDDSSDVYTVFAVVIRHV
jgi:hypothetical protein